MEKFNELFKNEINTNLTCGIEVLMRKGFNIAPMACFGRYIMDKLIKLDGTYFFISFQWKNEAWEILVMKGKETIFKETNIRAEILLMDAYQKMVEFLQKNKKAEA